MQHFITKDSGERIEFENWFHRDTDKGKLRYDLIPLNMIDRLAALYTRGMEKYGANNRQQARGEEAIERFLQSAFRHFMQYMKGEEDEDHAMAVVFNLFSFEWHAERVRNLSEKLYASEFAKLFPSDDDVCPRCDGPCKAKGPQKNEYDEGCGCWFKDCNDSSC